MSTTLRGGVSCLAAIRHAVPGPVHLAKHGICRQRQVALAKRWATTSSSAEAASGGGSSSSRATSSLLWLGLAAATAAAGFSLGLARQQGGAQASSPAPIPYPTYADTPTLERAIAEIRSKLGDDIITQDDEELLRHGYSEWSTAQPDVLPVAVAYPSSTAEVSAIVSVCNRLRIPVIPYSGGSSVEGNFSAPFGGISIDFANMDAVVALHEGDMDVVVQPGIRYVDLNEQLAARGSGLFFPIDPSPIAKIGGMVGTNCSGTHAVRYGTMKDWVLNLTVVLADGRVIKTRHRPRKSSAGYNLNGLFVGSEGTLGIVTEITLKLAVRPDTTSVAVVPFPTLRHAAAAAAEVIQKAVVITAMEIMDEVQMRVVNEGGATAPRMWKEVPTLFFKFSGNDEDVETSIRRIKDISARHNAADFEFAASKAEQDLLWSARKESLWSFTARCSPEEEVWNTDVAVPISRLADLIELSKCEMVELGLFAGIKGHIGDGNFHGNIIYNKTDPEQSAMVRAYIKKMDQRAVEMEGTCSGEHAIGYAKKDSLLAELGTTTVDVMKSLKYSLDPHWIMNPGKIFDHEKAQGK